MARPTLLVLSILLLVPYQAKSRFSPKTGGGLPLLEKGEEVLAGEEGAEAQRQRRRAECEGRWIHIRDLPPRFNTDLLRSCNAFPLYDDGDFCPYLANHGLGPRTHNRSRSWYRTDPHMLEPFFHRRLLEYPCLTPDPARADAVFLPYYASLDSLPFLYNPALFNSSALHGRDLADLLRRDSPAVSARRGGHDHFLVLARPAWDYSQEPDADPPLWGTSFLHLPDFLNVTVLALEARPWPWQERAVPHPTSFHPATLARLDAWLARARRARRTTLMLFAGGGGGGAPNIRGSIRAECENRTDLCEVVDCSDGSCAHDPIRFMRPMLRSSFCLQPPGDTPTRRSTFDGILAGCIPVFFEEIGARAQYGWHLPKDRFEEFSVFIPKEEVVFGGVRIGDVLESIPPAEVRRMRERVLELAPRVMYRRHGSSAGLRARKDAVDLAIDGVLRTVRHRVRALEDGDPDLLIYDDDGDDHHHHHHLS
ncbi:probable xyloglucan galactosyltransferase GT19 [Phoenix dactylifera]|uniref:Probable xyloglucan galactosyltransferase GT19 n=1 Tax=Phoenix dactylifera TaxID=42345 RepID=A0A8B7BWW2_PHODC|nr:probable xyloglucan galactosyltransferase GT19 [Phoenix dactylifera]